MRRRDDEGASMVMVLLVVVFIALVSTAFLTKSATEFRASSALQTKVRLQYGADAGLEKGLAVLNTELAGAVRTHCLTPFDGVQTLSTFTWGTSKYPVTVSCEDLQGFAADNSSGQLNGAAIVTTGGAGSLQSDSANSSTLDVGGTIYVSGAETSSGSSADLKKSINLTKGDYVQFGCTGSPGVAAVTVTAPYSQYCTSIPASQVATKVTLPSVPPTAAPFVDVANCRIFFPGKYTASPNLLSGNGKSNYFASGDYYFDGSYTISVGNNVEVIAGAKSPGDVDVAGSSGCSNDVAAQALTAAPGLITSTGAAFYMGGDSHIDVSQGTLVMYSRPITAGLDIPLSVYGLRSSDTGWDPWVGTTDIITTSTANGTMLFNGQINAYDAPVSIFNSNPSFAAARAGIVAKVLTLKASASGTNLDVTGYGTGSTVGSRKVRITAHAAGLSGDPGSSDGTAVVTIPNDLSAPTVESWRFQ